ncbi:MAG: hypothetical protein HY426_00770 [Candidatus Levybacteria bacterium]|nr:hypothetical protein [Candidatus Levybacteria bacterium]
MDPKNLSGLDPNLKAAYDRVMSAPINNTPPITNTEPPVAPNDPSHPSAEPVQAPPAAPPDVNPFTPPTTQNEPLAYTPSNPPGEQAQTVQTPAPVAEAPNQPTGNTSYGYTQPYPSQVLKTEKKSRVAAPIIFVLVLVFLLSYTFLWVRVFNLRVPFLP